MRLGTRSAVSPCSSNSRSLLLAVVVFVPGALWAQLTTGTIEGTLRATNGGPVAGSAILITGGAGFRTVIHSNSNGRFAMTLPYGRYRLSGDVQHGAESAGAMVFVAPLQTTHFDLVIDASASIRGVQPAVGTPGIWADATSGLVFPEAFSLAGLLLSREPSSVIEPLDFAGLSDGWLAVESQRGFSWTDTQYKFQGMDATDSYQPGLPAVAPDVQALDEVVVRSAFAQTASSSSGTEVGVFLAEPAASWHGTLSTANTPAGLRMLNTGLLAEAGTQWRQLTLHASFVAEKSYGPTNPGNAVYENDPGVIGALLLDPNTAIHAAGRSFVDRAYVGKIQASYRLPRAWGGFELASVADYTDGLVFARQLLVTGLPQGPFLVATTVRGSPEGGNRAQYVMNWNLRITRQFGLPIGRFAVSADILNVINAGEKLQENDLSGPSFNLRLPVAIQSPRFVQFGFRYEF